MTMGPKTFRVSEVSKVTRARLWSKTEKKYCKCFQEKKLKIRFLRHAQLLNFSKLSFEKIEKKKKTENSITAKM